MLSGDHNVTSVTVRTSNVITPQTTPGGYRYLPSDPIVHPAVPAMSQDSSICIIQFVDSDWRLLSKMQRARSCPSFITWGLLPRGQQIRVLLFVPLSHKNTRQAPRSNWRVPSNGPTAIRLRKTISSPEIGGQRAIASTTEGGFRHNNCRHHRRGHPFSL